MPVFDYQCEKCDTTFEVERPLGFSGRVKCASCGSMRTAKVFAPAGVVFKGSGFYVTDSAGKTSATTAPAANGSAPEAPADKPAPAPENKSKSDSTE
jgi:putative FmdB family regulatory protein